MGRASLLWTFFVFLPIVSLAQVREWFIPVVDRQGITQDLSNPASFLSPASIERKAQYKLPIDSSDMSYSPVYKADLENTGLEILGYSKWLNAFWVRGDQTDIESSLLKSYVIESARPMRRLSGGNHQEKSLASMNSQLAADFMRLPNPNESGRDGSGLVIAVFDSGFPGVNTLDAFDYFFSDTKLLATYNFVEGNANVFTAGQHGTNVLSVMAAKAEGMGYASGAHYVLAITEDDDNEGPSEEFNLVMALEWADSIGVDIVNISLGYSTFDDPQFDYVYADLNGRTAITSQAASMAAEKKILVVSSAGNEGNSAWRYNTTPGDAIGIIAVGATDNSGNRAFFSSFGPTADGRVKPELSTLGMGVSLMGSSGNVFPGSGTSFSAPWISAFAACLWQAYPTLNASQIRDIMMRSAHLSDNPNNELGYGIPNWHNAIFIAEGYLNPEVFPLVAPNPPKEELIVLWSPYAEGQEAALNLYNTCGQLVWSKEAIVDQGKTVSPLNTIGSGIYFLEMNSNGAVHRSKIFIP
jgi:serine protease AprX